jgi:hypothetical protein
VRVSGATDVRVVLWSQRRRDRVLSDPDVPMSVLRYAQRSGELWS